MKNQTDLVNLNLIDDSIANDIQCNMSRINVIFGKNGIANGMIYGFLNDCVDGQIIISLDKKPDHYVNKLSDFYIDDRVGFKNRKEVMQLVNDIGKDIAQIVKHKKAEIEVGDTVKASSKHPSNVVLRDTLEENPNVRLKIVSMERGLDPNYIGYYAVKSDQKPFKKNWFYVGSNDITREVEK